MRETALIMVVTIIFSVYISSVMSMAYLRSAYSKKSVWAEVEPAIGFIDMKTFGKKEVGVLKDSVINKRRFD